MDITERLPTGHCKPNGKPGDTHTGALLAHIWQYHAYVKVGYTLPHTHRQTHIDHKDTTVLTVVCTLFSLWNIPVTYVNDSCSLAPECRQVFTLKTKSGKRLKQKPVLIVLSWALEWKVLSVLMYLFVLFSDTFKLSKNVTWLKLNYKNTGFYIVDYGKDGWSALAKALKENVGVLTHEDRASLIHNIFALSRYQSLLIVFSDESLFLISSVSFWCAAVPRLSRVVTRLGRASFLQVLNLLRYVSADTETSPVTEALLQLNNIYRQLEKRQESNLASRMKVLNSHPRNSVFSKDRIVKVLLLTPKQWILSQIAKMLWKCRLESLI